MNIIPSPERWPFVIESHTAGRVWEVIETVDGTDMAGNSVFVGQTSYFFSSKSAALHCKEVLEQTTTIRPDESLHISIKDYTLWRTHPVEW